MTVAIPSADAPRQHLLLRNVSWGYYEHTLRELEAEHQHLRITYDRGRMEIMSPSPRHERAKRLIGMLIESYALERGLWFLGLGSVTCRREDLDRGLEPDECYYVQHRPRDPDELDLAVDPPPDLAVEVDITSASIARQPIYAALGVPEIWRFDGLTITVLLRQADGRYVPAETSLALPQLPMAQLKHFFSMGLTGDQHTAVMAFRNWLRAG